MLKVVVTVLQILSTTVKGTINTHISRRYVKEINDTGLQLLYNPNMSYIEVMNYNIRRGLENPPRTPRSNARAPTNPYEVVDSFFTWTFEPKWMIDHLKTFNVDCDENSDIIKMAAHYSAIIKLINSISLIHLPYKLKDIPLSKFCNLMFQRMNSTVTFRDGNSTEIIAVLKSKIKGLLFYLVPILNMIKDGDLTGSTITDHDELEDLWEDIHSHADDISVLARTLRENIQMDNRDLFFGNQDIRDLFFVEYVVTGGFYKIVAHIKAHIKKCVDPRRHFTGLYDSNWYLLGSLVCFAVPAINIPDFITIVKNQTPQIGLKTYESFVTYFHSPQRNFIEEGRINEAHYTFNLQALMSVVKETQKKRKKPEPLGEGSGQNKTRDASNMWECIWIPVGIIIIATVIGLIYYIYNK